MCCWTSLRTWASTATLPPRQAFCRCLPPAAMRHSMSLPALPQQPLLCVPAGLVPTLTISLPPVAARSAPALLPAAGGHLRGVPPPRHQAVLDLQHADLRILHPEAALEGVCMCARGYWGMWGMRLRPCLLRLSATGGAALEHTQRTSLFATGRPTHCPALPPLLPSPAALPRRRATSRCTGPW
jgi:hypothetical protein